MFSNPVMAQKVKQPHLTRVDEKAFVPFHPEAAEGICTSRIITFSLKHT